MNKTAVVIYTAAVSLCLVLTGLPAIAAEPAPSNTAAEVPLFSPFRLNDEDRRITPGDVSQAPLRLQLDQPFSLQQLGESVIGQAGSARALNTNMNYRIGDGMSLTGGMSLAESSNFLSLGSIHCENGVLDTFSYRAANCYFIDDDNRTSAASIAIGASYQRGQNLSASLNLFREERSRSNSLQSSSFSAGNSALLDPLGLNFLSGSALLDPAGSVNAVPGYANSERTGIDVEFQVGISTDQAGDLVLGLQLTRILDSGMEGVFYANPGMANWTIAKPYDSARLSLDWNRGAFSGGLDSYYRSPVNFIGRSELESEATFDVHFSWRAPWNASLSVGASNLLGASADDLPVTDGNLVDPLESIYGRIPYVRYKQDL